MKPIEFTDSEDETVKGDSEIAEYVQEVRNTEEMIKRGQSPQITPILSLKSFKVAVSPLSREKSKKTEVQGDSIVKITYEDIEEEVLFWNSAIVCYVLGANPPVQVFEGFLRRVWKDKIDRIGSPKHGIFVVRFHDAGIREQILMTRYSK